ncbi:MAG: PD-(D/E)XK nuclease family protein [Chloroflexi bacterium]|nr:PD-(D/E)XK nuclease family protein [Chloroflexota bacterium]
MYNTHILTEIPLADSEAILDAHTLEQVPVTRWTAFSWSHSRHTLFATCRRRYYLHYYGSRRIRETNSRVVRAIWWLKQITPMSAWIGTVVHEAAAAALRAVRDGMPVPDVRVLARERFAAGLEASARGRKLDGRWLVLWPDAYGGSGTGSPEELLEGLLDNLLASDTYKSLTNLPGGLFQEIDEAFQSFELEGIARLGTVRTFAIPDVLILNDRTLRIVDWKTGSTTPDSVRWQAGIYQLYAGLTYDLQEEEISVEIVDLTQGSSGEPAGGTPGFAETRAFIETSIAEMVDLMADVDYHTVSIRDFPMTDDLTLCQTCNFKRACRRE